MPVGAGINRVAPGIGQVKHEPMRHLVLHANLQAVVPGLTHIVPDAYASVVGVQPALAAPAHRRPILDNYTTAWSAGREAVTREPVRLLGPEELSPLRTDVVHFENRVGQDLLLEPEVVVVDEKQETKTAGSQRKV